MSETIEPAIPPEEWKAQLAYDAALRAERMQWAVNEADADGYLTRHGLAALCLYGKPYGFTRNDLEVLRDAAQHFHPSTTRGHLMVSLIERIAALLPPL